MINTRAPLQASVFFILCLVASVVLAQNAPLPTSPTYITVNGKPIPKARADLLASTMPPAQKPRDAEAMRKALTLPGPTDADEANMELGIALFRLGKKAEAVKAFDAVKDPEFAEVARLWKLRIR